MRTKVKIYTESSEWVPAEIDDSKNPRTARKVIDALPISAAAQRWGDEIYFPIKVSAAEEKSQIEVENGDLAYWPPGNSFCIFFGSTPASRGNKPAAASAVNVIGKVIGDSGVFKSVKNGEPIEIVLAE